LLCAALCVADSAAAQLQEAFNSHPQQVCQSLEAVLRLNMQDHELQSPVQDSGNFYNRAQVIVEAAHSCTTWGERASSSSSSSSRTADEVSVVEGAAAKQLFSFLVSCLKAAGQVIDDISSSSSSSSSSDVDRCDAAGDSANRAESSAGQLAHSALFMCSKVYRALKHMGSQQLQLLLLSRCLLQVAR
jgi:hypothetical protein